MTCKLGSICSYYKGKVDVSSLTVSNYISTENMQPNRGGIVEATNLPTTAQTQAFSVGDVLVSNIRPYFKKIWYATFDGGCSNDVLVFRANAGIDSFFLYYVLANDTFFNYATATAKGTKMPRGDKSAIMDFDVPDLTLQDQLKIAGILKCFDEKININVQMNRVLFEMSEAIYKNWFIDYCPYGGSAPQDWPVVKLERMASLISRGIAPKYADESDQLVANQKCIRNHVFDISQARTHEPKKVNEKWLEYGDLLINSTGEGTLGRTAQVLFEPVNLTVDSHVTIVRPAKRLYAYYIGLWGMTHEREIEALHTGSTGQTELPRDRVKTMELMLPDEGTLKKFNDVISEFSALSINNQAENAKLAELRDTLLPKLMSGELDVSELDI